MEFGATVALDRFNLDVFHGEIHGLIGHNGSGKSTLAKVLSGFNHPRSGQIEINGVPVALPVSPGVGDHGIAVVHQDLCLSPEMSVIENLVLTRSAERFFMPTNGRHERRRWLRYLGMLDVTVDLETLIADVAPADRAGVAIARSLRTLEESDMKGLLIVDESTAYFSSVESRQFARILKRVAAQGHGVLFIGHNLEEVIEVCDRITVLRSGKVVDTVASSSSTPDGLVSLMLGRRLESFYPDRAARPLASSPKVLELDSLAVAGRAAVSIFVRSGEIVGVTGRVASGYEEIPYAVVGAIRHDGSVWVEGRPARLNPHSARRRGIALVPSDRAKHGMWMSGTAMENYAAGRAQQFVRGGRMRRSLQLSETQQAMRSYLVRPPHPEKLVSQFSGGNQQKVLLASRYIAPETRVLILHEPTQGVDAGAKRELLDLISQAASEGVGVLIFSAEHEDLINACHRVVVVSPVAGVVLDRDSDQLNENDILSACVDPTPESN